MLIMSHFEWTREATMLRVIQEMVTWRHKAPLAGSDGYLPISLPQHFARAGCELFLTRTRKREKAWLSRLM